VEEAGTGIRLLSQLPRGSASSLRLLSDGGAGDSCLHQRS